MDSTEFYAFFHSGEVAEEVSMPISFDTSLGIGDYVPIEARSEIEARNIAKALGLVTDYHQYHHVDEFYEFNGNHCNIFAYFDTQDFNDDEVVYVHFLDGRIIGHTTKSYSVIRAATRIPEHLKESINKLRKKKPATVRRKLYHSAR